MNCITFTSKTPHILTIEILGYTDPLEYFQSIFARIAPQP